MKCPNCGEQEHILDHREFGLPGWYHFRCERCGHLWLEKEEDSSVN